MIKRLLEKSPVKVSVEPVRADEGLRYQNCVDCPVAESAPAYPEAKRETTVAEERKINIVWPLAGLLVCQLVIICVILLRGRRR